MPWRVWRAGEVAARGQHQRGIMQGLERPNGLGKAKDQRNHGLTVEQNGAPGGSAVCKRCKSGPGGCSRTSSAMKMSKLAKAVRW